MSQAQVLTLDNKQEKHLKTCEYAGGHFKLTPKGVSFIGRNKDGDELPSRWICSPFHITAKTRDEKSGEWGRLLKWYDDDGVKHQWAMPLALLHGDGIEIRKELARLGLTISPSKLARDLLISYIQIFPLDRRARCVDKLGWHGDVFVTASDFIGQSSESVVFQNTNAIEPALSVSGTVEAWRDSIARLAAGNSRLVFALSTVLVN
jgi:putative DNA primase/helicase